MRIIVPFTSESRMIDAVKLSLAHDEHFPELILMERPESYYELVKELWEAGEPFLINEHDIIAWPGAISQVQLCDHPWCTFPYRCPAGWISNGLGLVKFEPRRLPNIFEDDFEEKDWKYLDTQIVKRLASHQMFPHLHRPAVTNLNRIIWLVPQRCDMIEHRFRTQEESKFYVRTG